MEAHGKQFGQILADFLQFLTNANWKVQLHKGRRALYNTL